MLLLDAIRQGRWEEIERTAFDRLSDPDLVVRVDAHYSLAVINHDRRNAVAAVMYAHRSKQWSPQPPYDWRAELLLGCAMREECPQHVSESRVLRAFEIAQSHGDLVGVALSTLAKAWGNHRRGALNQCRFNLEEARALLAVHGTAFEHFEVLYDSGILYREHGHYADAAQAFDRAEALAQTEDLPAAIQCIRASRAILWIAEERFADAREVLEHALLNVRTLRLERYEPHWLRQLANCHAGLGQFTVAIQIAEAAMQAAMKISNLQSARECARLLGDLQEMNGQSLLAVQTGAHLAEIDRMQARLQEQIVGELAAIMLN